MMMTVEVGGPLGVEQEKRDFESEGDVGMSVYSVTGLTKERKKSYSWLVGFKMDDKVSTNKDIISSIPLSARIDQFIENY